MKKIISGILGIVLIAGVVGGAAVAAFTSKATVGGVTFATGNADLKVYNGTEWVNDWSPSNFNFAGMYPAYENYKMLYLKNMSTSPIALTVKGTLRNGVIGDWAALKDKVSVNVWLSADNNTGYHSLADWNSTGYELQGGNLAQNEQKNYRFYVMVDPSADNTLATKNLSGVNFDFTGTQVMPL